MYSAALTPGAMTATAAIPAAALTPATAIPATALDASHSDLRCCPDARRCNPRHSLGRQPLRSPFTTVPCRSPTLLRPGPGGAGLQAPAPSRFGCRTAARVLLFYLPLTVRSRHTDALLNCLSSLISGEFRHPLRFCQQSKIFLICYNLPRYLESGSRIYTG